jgi:hypothetical protein
MPRIQATNSNFLLFRCFRKVNKTGRTTNSIILSRVSHATKLRHLFPDSNCGAQSALGSCSHGSCSQGTLYCAPSPRVVCLTRNVVYSGMLCSVALVRTDVAEKLSAAIIRVTTIGEIEITLAITSNRRSYE